MKSIELISDAISGELETKNNRINWLLISQSFIFVAFGIIHRTLASTGETSALRAMSPLIPTLGVFISVLTLVGISGCYRAIYILANEYNSSVDNLSSGAATVDKDILKKLVFKDVWSKWIGIIYSYLICIGILSLWTYALIKL